MIGKPLVSIIIVCWNGRPYLPLALKSLVNQDYQRKEVILVDNASRDGSPDFVIREYPTIKVIRNRHNLGFCHGNNQGLKAAKGQYALFLNQDLVINPDFISRQVEFLEQHHRAGACQGKLLHYDFKKNTKTTIVDCYEVKAFRNRRFIDLGQGCPDDNQHDNTRPIFAATGAALFARRKALQDAAAVGYCFDEKFIAYKEDIDLCWRLQRLDWQIWAVPQAIGYHGRSSLKSTKEKRWSYIKNERRKPLYVRQMSPRNHYLMLVKNEYSIPRLFINPSFIWRELQLLVHHIFFEPRVLKAYWQFLVLLPQACRDRKIINPHCRLSRQFISRWFVKNN